MILIIISRKNVFINVQNIPALINTVCKSVQHIKIFKEQQENYEDSLFPFVIFLYIKVCTKMTANSSI